MEADPFFVGDGDIDAARVIAVVLRRGRHQHVHVVHDVRAPTGPWCRPAVALNRDAQAETLPHAVRGRARAAHCRPARPASHARPEPLVGGPPRRWCSTPPTRTHSLPSGRGRSTVRSRTTPGSSDDSWSRELLPGTRSWRSMGGRPSVTLQPCRPDAASPAVLPTRARAQDGQEPLPRRPPGRSRPRRLRVRPPGRHSTRRVLTQIEVNRLPSGWSTSRRVLPGRGWRGSTPAGSCPGGCRCPGRSPRRTDPAGTSS